MCDDFEAQAPGALPGSPWRVSLSTSGASVTIDGTRAYSGARSVKVAVPAAAGYRSALLALESPTLPVKGNVVYGRMMFWLQAASTADVHWTFIDGYGRLPGETYHAVYRYGGQHPVSGGSQLMANYDTPDAYASVGIASDCWLHSGAKLVPVGRWACAEWRFDGAANAMRLWLDGQELTDLAVNGIGQGCVHQGVSFPWTAPTFERIDVGWESYQADDARTIWIDDLAVGTERIGCP